MRTILLGTTLVVLAVALPVPAATITFSDGQAHTISTSLPNTNVVVSGGSTLDLVSGAAITAPSSTFGTIGVVGTGAGTSVVATGGSVTGGSSSFTGAQGANGLSVNSDVSLALSGGTFTGGSGASGGNGLFVAIPPGTLPGGTRTISGGTFVGGNSTDPVAGLPGDGAAVAHAATISGGTFISGTGGMSTLIPIALSMATAPGEVITVSGGVYQGALLLTSDLTSTGPTGTLDVLGSGLSFTGGHFLAPGIFEGTLAGTLSDGHSVNNLVLINSSLAPSVVATPGEILFSTTAAPEPASVVLFGSGLLGVLALARGRRR